MARSRAQQAAIAVSKKKLAAKKTLKKANDGIVVKATSPKGQQLATNAQDKKNAIQALVGTKTPDGKVVTQSNAAQVYKLMKKRPGGPMKRRPKGVAPTERKTSSITPVQGPLNENSQLTYNYLSANPSTTFPTNELQKARNILLARNKKGGTIKNKTNGKVSRVAKKRR